MTLKEFAVQNSLNYQTAKTWFRRGKIREVSKGKFQLSETELKPAETMPCSIETLREVSKPDPFETLNPETLKPSVTANDFANDFDMGRPPTHAPFKQNVAPGHASATPETCAGCESLRERIDALAIRVADLELTGAFDAESNPRWLNKSNYTGPHSSLGETFND